MDADSWSDSLSTSKRYQSRNDLYLAFDDIESDDDPRAEYACPFCTEDFDIIGLCCHIDDEHPEEARNGVCPVCGMRVGMDMVAHITMEHGQFFKMQRRRRFRKGGSHSTLSLLKKELQDANLQALLGGSSLVPSSNAAPDPLLSSFFYNLPMIGEPTSIQSHCSAESSPVEEISDEHVQERNVQPPALSDKDHEEKASRSEFVQGLLLSTMFDDIL